MRRRSFDPTDAQAGREAALRCLARRDYCSSELCSKLVQRGFERKTATAVVAALEQNKILDERQYIEHFISYQAGRGQGPNRIGRKLRTLGLDFEQVGELLEAGQDWVSRAREVRRKKFGAVLPMVREDRLRQSSFLHYRGFTTAQIREALKENVDIDVCA